MKLEAAGNELEAAAGDGQPATLLENQYSQGIYSGWRERQAAVTHSSVRASRGSCSKVFQHSVHEMGRWKKLLRALKYFRSAPLAVFTSSEFPVPYSPIDAVFQILYGITHKFLHPRQSTDLDSNI